MEPSFTVASWNVHCGVDGWGRPFDVARRGAALDADVILVQESWRPAHGDSSAGLIAKAMGARLVETPLAQGRRGRPHEGAGTSWFQPGSTFGGDHSLYLETPARASSRYDEAEEGEWCIAIVSRLALDGVQTIPLDKLRRDAAQRQLLVAEARVEKETVTIATTHLAHLTQGSHRQFRTMHQALHDLGGPHSPTVLGGDMNCWGPLVSLQVPSWRRAVRGRTWPAWRPHSQLDHLLVGRALRVLHSEVMTDPASDHLAIRSRLALNNA